MSFIVSPSVESITLYYNKLMSKLGQLIVQGNASDPYTMSFRSDLIYLKNIITNYLKNITDKSQLDQIIVNIDKTLLLLKDQKTPNVNPNPQQPIKSNQPPIKSNNPPIIITKPVNPVPPTIITKPIPQPIVNQPIIVNPIPPIVNNPPIIIPPPEEYYPEEPMIIEKEIPIEDDTEEYEPPFIDQKIYLPPSASDEVIEYPIIELPESEEMMVESPYFTPLPYLTNKSDSYFPSYLQSTNIDQLQKYVFGNTFSAPQNSSNVINSHNSFVTGINNLKGKMELYLSNKKDTIPSGLLKKLEVDFDTLKEVFDIHPEWEIPGTNKNKNFFETDGPSKFEILRGKSEDTKKYEVRPFNVPPAASLERESNTTDLMLMKEPNKLLQPEEFEDLRKLYLEYINNYNLYLQVLNTEGVQAAKERFFRDNIQLTNFFNKFKILQLFFQRSESMPPLNYPYINVLLDNIQTIDKVDNYLYYTPFLLYKVLDKRTSDVKLLKFYNFNDFVNLKYMDNFIRDIEIMQLLSNFEFSQHVSVPPASFIEFDNIFLSNDNSGVAILQDYPEYLTLFEFRAEIIKLQDYDNAEYLIRKMITTIIIVLKYLKNNHLYHGNIVPSSIVVFPDPNEIGIFNFKITDFIYSQFLTYLNKRGDASNIYRDLDYYPTNTTSDFDALKNIAYLSLVNNNGQLLNNKLKKLFDTISNQFKYKDLEAALKTFNTFNGSPIFPNVDDILNKDLNIKAHYEVEPDDLYVYKLPKVQQMLDVIFNEGLRTPTALHVIDLYAQLLGIVVEDQGDYNRLLMMTKTGEFITFDIVDVVDAIVFIASVFGSDKLASFKKSSLFLESIEENIKFRRINENTASFILYFYEISRFQLFRYTLAEMDCSENDYKGFLQLVRDFWYTDNFKHKYESYLKHFKKEDPYDESFDVVDRKHEIFTLKLLE
jgi:hypothetical protein